ncbi:hypothetical protein Psi01_84860 [Planobispora siamensis]|uniref:Anti-sigma factor antagonist n=2 Tax=Planobispora siamensis TaxID=936338 RepID=A0A8J3SNW2_9ACTN|nr:hypothetical protein Psi01_84860 [Planobispora siamensis]
MVARLDGELGPSTTPTLRESVWPLWERSDVTAVVLDVTGVLFCDSVGLRALIGVRKQGQAAHKRLALSGVQGTLARLLALTGLVRSFEIHDTAHHAVQALTLPEHST